MGRRALPKIDASVPLDRHLFRLAEIQGFQEIQELFFGQQPLEVEVGSGKGLFLTNQSGMVTSHNFLGIEISEKYARYSAYRLAKVARDNAVMICGDAQQLFREILPANSIIAVHVYFPDPWWKARHRKRRVVSDSFVRQVERVLLPGGYLHFWTDVEEYFQSGCATISSFTNLVGPIPEQALPSEQSLETGQAGFITHYDRRMLVNDHQVFRCKFQKLENRDSRIQVEMD